MSWVGVPFAQAVSDLHVKEELRVFRRANRNSKVITRLSKGDVVVVSPKHYGQFRKVLVTYRGKKRGGYVHKHDIYESQIIKRSQLAKSNTQLAYSQYQGIGVSVAHSILRQGERSIETDASEVYQISTFESQSNFFSLFFDLPVGESSALRSYLSLRNTAFTGDAELEDVSAQSGAVVLNQTFIALGVFLKFYSRKTSWYWWGLGSELAKGTEVDLSVNGGTKLETTDEDLPFFVMASGGLGWDIPVYSSLYFTPEIRFGAVINNDPMILAAEAYLSFAYAFY